MNKQEAIQAMNEGKKVTHRFFSCDEYITMKDGFIVDEKNYKLDVKEFWNYRSAPNWETGWDLFDTPSTNTHWTND